MDRDSSLGMVSSLPPGNPRFPIDIPIVPLFSTRDQRNLCTFYSRVMALPRLESLNFDGSNLDGRINDYNLFNTANQLYLPSWKIVSTKKSIWKKKRLNIFVKLAYSFFIAFPLSNFLFILTIRVLYIFINVTLLPSVVNFQSIVQTRSHERIEEKKGKSDSVFRWSTVEPFLKGNMAFPRCKQGETLLGA